MYGIGGEKESVQKALIDYVKEPAAEYTTSIGLRVFVNLGWEYVTPADAIKLRGGETGLIFKEVFKSQVLKLNKGFITEDKAEELTAKLEKLPARIEGNLECWEYLCGLKTVFDTKEKRERNVKLLDERVENNIFQVTDEFEFTNGVKTNRYDVVFLINGIPLLFVETKAARKLDGIAESLDQVIRYHRETPEAMTLLQVYALTQIIQFYYSATWNLSAKNLYNWKTESKIREFEGLVKTFFDRRAIVEMLLKSILFTRQDDELKKVVLRPHQIRAVAKVVERAVDPAKQRGLVWHTQGSGKTYSMILAAKRILENPKLENPTVLMLVDRNELESQLFSNLRSVGFEIDDNRIAGSKRHLRQLLQTDTRGLLVSMIHKFEDMPANINTRRNIFVLVDEAHRTTGGDLGNYLMAALPNATYIGFTGTPIDRTAHGKGTFVVFGKDDEKGYLDKYSIVESIEDSTTVKLHYTLAPNELRPQKELLEKEFLNLVEAQGMTDVETLNKVLEKAVNLRNMLKSRERIEKVAKFVKDHFTEYVEPMGYKAFLVAVDREACALYKEALDKVLPEEYSKVVMSTAYNDQPELARYHLSEEEEKRIRKAFRKPDELPKILIVTEKLLTGFDAPILYCMYLDKPMRDHALLQAIARVNRPYEDEQGRKKPCGFVLDFVGIFDELEKALAFDSADVKEIQNVVQDIQKLKERFKELFEKGEKEYSALIGDKTRDKAVEAILEYFLEEEKRNEYYRFYKELSEIYEIISPDAFLRPYVKAYKKFSEIYMILKEAYEGTGVVDWEFTRKTAQLVQEFTKSGQIELTLDVYEINEDTLRKLQGSKASDTEKVFNLLRSLQNTMERESTNNPYLISIGEKAERISQLYKERQKTTQETLEEIKKLVEEINAAREEQKKSGMSMKEFSIYRILKEANMQNSDVIARQIRGVLESYPHWRTSEEQRREAKNEINKILVTNRIGVTQSVAITNRIIDILRRAEA